MSYDSNNIFAKIIKGDIPSNKVYEDDKVLAFKDINPRAPIHILVIPKGSYENFHDFAKKASLQEQAAIFNAVKSVVKSQGIEETGYRVIANTGKNGGQEVPHFHFHILGGGFVGNMPPLFKG